MTVFLLRSRGLGSVLSPLPNDHMYMCSVYVHVKRDVSST